MKRITAVWPVLALTIALVSALPAQAVDVKFTGILVVPPPCVINSNSDISVVFGNDLLVGRIDGVSYEQPISYTLDCTEATSAKLKLQFQGGGASFDASVLGTSKTDLGLELRSNGDKLPMNTWLSFTDTARPTLTAVPVKATASALSGGSFTATTTLLVDYL